MHGRVGCLKVEIIFDYSAHEGRISVIEPWIGMSGWMTATLLSVDALGQSEDYLLLAVRSDDNTEMSNEQASRLLTIGARAGPQATLPDQIATELALKVSKQQNDIRKEISERNIRFLGSRSTSWIAGPRT